MKAGKLHWILLFLTLNMSSLLGAQEAIEAETRIDWSRAVIDINITADLPFEINVLPEAKIHAENRIEDAIPLIIQIAMEDVILDSTLNVFERLKKDLHLTSLIDNYSDERYKIRTNLSPDLLKLKAHYSIPLYPDFSSTFIEHKEAAPLDRILHYVPGQNYTGIVIYASGTLPLFGENKEEALNPSLFPKILNERGEVIFSAENVDPGILKEHGAVLFTDHLDKVPVQRVGLLPLKIKATAIYGRNRTDIVIPSYLSDRILSRETNRELLHNGRITIVCAKEKIRAELYFKR